MDNYKLQQYITVYGRDTELAETVFSRFPTQAVFKKNINLKRKKTNYLNLRVEMD